MAVVELDHEETRRIIVVHESYVETGEFEAFDGVVYVVVYPDGDCQWI